MRCIVRSTILAANEHHTFPFNAGQLRQFAGDCMSAFAVTSVARGVGGRVTHVVRGVLDMNSKHLVSVEALAPVADVVDAIHNGDQVRAVFPTTDRGLHEREFVVVQFEDGIETVE
jgi:hypothetical protein